MKSGLLCALERGKLLGLLFVGLGWNIYLKLGLAAFVLFFVFWF